MKLRVTIIFGVILLLTTVVGVIAAGPPEPGPVPAGSTVTVGDDSILFTAIDPEGTLYEWRMYAEHSPESYIPIALAFDEQVGGNGWKRRLELLGGGVVAIEDGDPKENGFSFMGDLTSGLYRDGTCGLGFADDHQHMFQVSWPGGKCGAHFKGWARAANGEDYAQFVQTVGNPMVWRFTSARSSDESHSLVFDDNGANTGFAMTVDNKPGIRGVSFATKHTSLAQFKEDSSWVRLHGGGDAEGCDSPEEDGRISAADGRLLVCDQTGNDRGWVTLYDYSG